MKSEKNIFVAFTLNLLFSIIELFGGIFTKSISIISDAMHDFGDALSIGISLILEKISHKKPNEIYTYGYGRYSVLGALISNCILLAGSIIIIYSSIKRLINPVAINYDGMIIISIFGVLINFAAAYITKGGDSLNQKAVNLHMLEDVLGWIVVLIGAIIMRFTNFFMIDAILSIGVSVYILIHVIHHMKDIVDLFLEKTPEGMSADMIKQAVLKVDGVVDVHHIHLWSIDGHNNYLTMHVVTNKGNNIKGSIRKVLSQLNINHVTMELEKSNEYCSEETCFIKSKKIHSHHH